MESLMEDYDFPNENPELSTFMIAKHRSTGKLYYFQSVPLLNLTSNDSKALLKRITARTQIKHPNILNFYEPLQNDDLLHLRIEYCKYHTLTYLIQNDCTKTGKQLHEQLLCRILYQTAFALKTVECFMGSLNSDTVLLDEHYNVKLYNFFNVSIQGKAQKQKEVKMSELGILIYEACSLKNFDKSKYENELQALNYTESFKSLVLMMVKDQSEIKKHLNKILCNPTVLLQSSEWKIDNCFMELKQEALKKDNYEARLEKLRRREAALQIKEQLINEQERKLANKEKRLQIMERNIKEKLQQAELYLKRCREGGKSISSGSSHSSSIKHLYNEEIEASYVTHEEIEVQATSTKLQVDKIVKPSNFSRTLSERRIRFKTSPLKDRNFARKKSVRQPKILEEDSKVDIVDKRKSLMFLPPEYENDVMTAPCSVRTMWSDETKKYAFEMLRILNSDEKENIEVKHTIL